jgi:hypothetical protein
MVREVLALAEEVGAELRWWNAWNEPDHPFFMSPQRAACDVASPSVSVGAYVRLNAALQDALDLAPGEQERILGELAGTRGPTEHLTSVQEFIAALPADLLCGTRVWGQHAFLAPRDDGRVAREALALRGCAQPHAIWVTETGVYNGPQTPHRCAAAPLPEHAPADAGVVPRSAGHRRVPVHPARGRPVPIRPDRHRPRGGLPGARAVAGVGGTARSTPDAPAPGVADACREPSPAG